MKTYITPYKMGSKSAKDLARGIRVLRTNGNKRFFKPTTIINWGSSSLSPLGRVVRVINNPSAVRLATNKSAALQTLESAGVSVVESTSDSAIAMRWVEDGCVVFGRAIVNASQGLGIKVLTQDDRFISGLPLYTKGVIKAHEFRVHVAFGKVIDFSKKRRSSSHPNPNPYIKNHSNGWVFCRDGITLPKIVADACIKAVQVLGLDFGAVDIGYREIEDKTWIFEVNTAPGIEGTTLTKYIEAFRGQVNND